MAEEMVEHPKHYNNHPSGVECIDLVEYLGFNLGNAVKYIWRRNDKGKPSEDLKKAEFYFKRFIDRVHVRNRELAVSWPPIVYDLARKVIANKSDALLSTVLEHVIDEEFRFALTATQAEMDRLENEAINLRKSLREADPLAQGARDNEP